MTPTPFAPPAVGDIVWCRFPEDERIGTPGPKPRPALVVGVGTADGTIGVRVAYGTSQGTNQLRRGDFLITPQDGQAFKESGLSYPTKFRLERTHRLPFDDRWFSVPAKPRFGQTPKLGVVSISLQKRVEAAVKALAGPG